MCKIFVFSLLILFKSLRAVSAVLYIADIDGEFPKIHAIEPETAIKVTTVTTTSMKEEHFEDCLKKSDYLKSKKIFVGSTMGKKKKRFSSEFIMYRRCDANGKAIL
jgi:hypothetical protein